MKFGYIISEEKFKKSYAHDLCIRMSHLSSVWLRRILSNIKQIDNAEYILTAVTR